MTKKTRLKEEQKKEEDITRSPSDSNFDLIQRHEKKA